jgi:putative ABC transport system permease protein
MGIELIAGRFFSATGDRLRPAIVNRTFATRAWPTTDPIGQQLRLDSGEWRRVVGVVSDARQQLDESPMAEVFVPLDQYPPVQARLVVRTPISPERMAESLREAVRRAEPQQPIDTMLTLEGARDESVAPVRVTATLITALALIGTTISLIGVAGVVGASVQARTSQLGLQMALGATRGRMIADVLRDGVRLVAAGVAFGLPLAAIMGRALRGFLFEISPYDPSIHAGAMFLLAAATVLACLIPARRAALVDPCVALRVG